VAHASARVPALANRLLPLPRRWRTDGRLRRAHDRLREEVREATGILARPSHRQPGRQDHPGGRPRAWLRWRKAPLRAQAPHLSSGHQNGLVLAARVHSANLPDRGGGSRLLDEALQRELPRMELIWADGAYTSGFGEWAHHERG
jgi:hypothetical protein